GCVARYCPRRDSKPRCSRPISPNSCPCARKAPPSATASPEIFSCWRTGANGYPCSSRSGKNDWRTWNRPSPTNANAPRSWGVRQNLNQLIAKLEQGLDTASRAARAAARSSEDGKAASGRPDLAPLKDPGRRSPAIAFAAAKGMLPLPVNGARIKEFGAADGLGGTEKGVSIAARPGGQITAPCDGWVVYAGPFRNYGQLLILN